MDNLPHRYKQQIEEAEVCLKKMEESLQSARETLEHAKKLLKHDEGGQASTPPKPPDAIS